MKIQKLICHRERRVHRESPSGFSGSVFEKYGFVVSESEKQFSLIARRASKALAVTFSVNAVFSDGTTSHSTKLPKDGSKVAGYVANKGLFQ